MEKSSFNLLTAIVSPLYVHLTDKLSLSYTYIIPHPLPQSQISTYTILHRNLKNKYIYSIINIEKEKEIIVMGDFIFGMFTGSILGMFLGCLIQARRDS
jgi:hypothetical protein